jgi:exopolyphosphatase/guanosine-5'-triphosphate,3'-diphosphate pyrophosphatase
MEYRRRQTGLSFWATIENGGTMNITTFAAISIGSYELEMKIFEMSAKGGIREVDRISHVIELGKDTYNQDKISFEMVDNLCGILYDFSRIMKEYRVKAYKACATSAIREAKNAKSVLDRVKVRTGLEVELLSNSEQRFLSYKAFTLKKGELEDFDSREMLLVDMGAGSAQVTIFDHGEIVTTQNIRLGVLRVREVLARLASNGDKYREILEEYIGNDLDTFSKIFLSGHKITDIVGIGENMSYVNFTGDDKTCISKKEFGRVYSELVGKSEAELADRLDIPESHASLVMPSLMLFTELFHFTDARNLWVPAVRLCDGIAVDYAQKNHLIKLAHDFDGDILAATRKIASRYRCNEKHVEFVENTSLVLFDATRKLHGLGQRERLILQIAAILHDVGKFVSLMYPSEAAYNIIITTEIIGLSHEERLMVANIVKYVVLDFDYDCMSLTAAKLTSILRLANALDRSHKQKMRNLRATLEGNQLVLSTQLRMDATLESGLFGEKTEVFREIYGVVPVIRQRK